MKTLSTFEWDPEKARTNYSKHGVSFEESITAFADPYATDVPDYVYADRMIVIGMSMLSRVLFVVYAENSAEGRIRIISARRANRAQWRTYEASRK